MWGNTPHPLQRYSTSLLHAETHKLFQYHSQQLCCIRLLSSLSVHNAHIHSLETISCIVTVNQQRNHKN
jgi:hypothetical protein